MKGWKVAAVFTLCAVFVLACLAGCGGSKQDEEAAVESSYDIDYGESEMYTQEDMDAAIDVIMTEFNSWEGCTMNKLSFTDDTMCADNVSYVQELKPEGNFDQCIVFKSNFHSPKDVEGTAWEADTDYDGWEWYLARSNGGNWELLTWGY